MGFGLLTDDLEMNDGLEVRYRMRPVLRMPLTWTARVSEVR
jgi:hypothetical protein